MHRTDDTEPADSAGFADFIRDFLIAAGVGCIIGAAFLVAALSVGIRVPGLIG